MDRIFHSRRAFVPVALVLLALTLAGCEGPTKLPVTPNVLRDGSGARVLAELPQDQHVVDMPIIYATDRARSTGMDKPAAYGAKRSAFMSFGQATVSLDPAPNWDELVRASGSAQDRRYQMSVSKIEEVGRFAFTPASFEMFEGSLRIKPDLADRFTGETEKFMSLIRSRLAVAKSKDVYLYVHGVDNSFDDAVSRAAVMWHYIGRQGAFVAFSWPAGYGGVTGYFYDRESGEFSVHHLKAVISEIAKSPDVERLHIIAHSRGCDVATTALREINLECRIRGLSTQKELKLETLVLAAADLDVEVFSLRLALENVAVIARRVVIYSSSKDSLVSLSDWLFNSRARLGMLSKQDIEVSGQTLLAQIPNLQAVQCSVSGFGTSHDYMFTNPGAMSDLVLLLRDRKDPGAANGRPLTPLGGSFWKLDNDYALLGKNGAPCGVQCVPRP